MNRRYSLFLFLLAPFLANADKGKTAWQGPDKPVYVVTKNHYAEGFTPEGDTARFGDLIAIEIFNPIARPADHGASYNVGERLSFFLGGQRKGEVKIEKVMPLQCDSSAAIVSAGPAIHLVKETMGLATNAKVISHESTQRQANDEEKKIAIRLAMDEFRKHGVPEDSASQIEFEQSIVTRIDQSESQTLIAYLHFKFKSVQHEVFLIGKLDRTTAMAEMARYHKMTDLVDGKDYEGYRFVDQLDLDGDGTDEIVVEVTGYESEEFRILKRVNGAWVRVHAGGQGGC